MGFIDAITVEEDFHSPFRQNVDDDVLDAESTFLDGLEDGMVLPPQILMEHLKPVLSQDFLNELCDRSSIH